MYLNQLIIYKYIFHLIYTQIKGMYTCAVCDVSDSPVGLLLCKLPMCWRGSKGPRPWCERSSGAFLRGKPRSCHRGGRSNRSGLGPAGGEARLVMRWGALDEEKTREKERQEELSWELKWWNIHTVLGGFVCHVALRCCLSSDFKVLSCVKTDRGL